MGNQASTPLPEDQERKDGNFPTVESWNDAETRLVVSQPDGWACKVSLQTKIAMPPAELFELLTKPDNTDIFRNIKRMKKREVLEDDKRGRQLIAVQQEGTWKFLVFSGTLHTNLLVDQNRRTREIDFRLREPGLMKKFEGKWRIEPFNQASLDSNFGYKDQVNARHKLGFNPIAMIGTFGNSRLLSLMKDRFPHKPLKSSLEAVVLIRPLCEMKQCRALIPPCGTREALTNRLHCVHSCIAFNSMSATSQQVLSSKNRLATTTCHASSPGFRREEEVSASLLTLEQSLLPSVTPPKALQGVTKGIAVRQVRNLIEDVRSEIDRRAAGS